MTTQHFTHCRIETTEDGIARLTLDVAESATNAVSLEVIEDLHAALDELDSGSSVRGLILDSAKSAGFAVGLSAAALQQLTDDDYARELVQRGQALTYRLAEWRQPTVALLRGTCQNGGLELALAARYRVAEGRATTFGFPEVHLGMHPYWGGTAYLADIIGATPALQLLLSGRSVATDEARSMGLVDATVDVTADAQALDATARDLLTRRPPPGRPRGWRWLVSLGPVRWTMEIIRRADYREPVIPASHPATTALYALYWQHGSESLYARVSSEGKSVRELWRKPATRNLVGMFLSQERIRLAGRDERYPAPARVHLVGCGTIGTEIAAELALHGTIVSFEDRSPAAVEALKLRSAALFRERLGDDAAFRAAEERLQPTATDASLAGVDLAIEAVTEDATTKQAVLADLSQRLDASAVIATTTSTLSIEALAAAVTPPERLIGLHFTIGITNLALAGLVEVVHADATSNDAIDRGCGLVHGIGYLPLAVRDSPGFLVHRLLVPYILEGARRYTRPQREVVDGAGRYVGMKVGPLELADWIGLDRCLALAENLTGQEELDIPEALREQVDAGHLGRKTGRGFHDWRGYRRVTSALPPRHDPISELGPMLIEPLVTEAERCMDEAIVADEERLAIGAVAGAGFPAYTGGPINYRREMAGSADKAREAEKNWLERARSFTRI